jgi:hypothetical protein
VICSANARGELTAMCIDDPDLAASALAYLRRRGAPEYPSLQAYRERSSAEPAAAPDPAM